MSGVRVGIGYDSHRFVVGRPLILGGVTIPHTHGLDGHSDADAVAHALTDALLGAAGAGDIGRLFPDNDRRYENADSMVLLAQAYAVVRQAGWRAVNADVTIIVQRPKIAPWADQMAAGLAARLGLPAGAVHVKAKTNEGMGFIGRGEGIAVMCVALLEAA
ncbi:MAG: 2-C-methyl-D-erythritol 2,4-cyclodiphosphate synthase [Gemmatimonadales bacterium]|nr:2-C-methyl-D-erythritol 2,4-cyclodiphosphate synthase [Gemmatimonadales bacterium]